MIYEHELLLTFEVTADSEDECKDKVKAFKRALFNEHAVVNSALKDIMLISITKPKG
jgi:hypothetical protein